MSILDKVTKSKEEKGKSSGEAKTKTASRRSGNLPQHYFELVLKPYISEKAFDGNEKRKYVFVVASKANKTEVRKAVEGLYQVSVASVNMLRTAAKPKRYRGRLTEKRGFKKAVVTLKEGSSIDVMDVAK